MRIIAVEEDIGTARCDPNASPLPSPISGWPVQLLHLVSELPSSPHPNYAAGRNTRHFAGLGRCEEPNDDTELATQSACVPQSLPWPLDFAAYCSCVTMKFLAHCEVDMIRTLRSDNHEIYLLLLALVVVV